MAQRITRRQALRRGLAASAGLWVATRPSSMRAASPNEKLDIACIGVGGRGAANVRGLSSENIVALCDVDQKRGAESFEKHPKARRFTDYRRLLDELGGSIDAVVVSTPDHTHFHPAYHALELGKPVYLEKPMAHSVWETRTLTRLAQEKGVATQLGVQRHTHGNVHRVVELIRARAIGEVKECHAWIGGSRGMPGLPDEFPAVPEHLDWNLWLGPAEYRKYSPAFCPYRWRFWWDFGTGETGNWGCHILDIPFWALELDHPTRVEASGPPVHEEMTPKSMRVEYAFPARGDRGPVALHWYHTKEGPPVLKEHGLPHWGTGVLFVGTKGLLYCDFGKRKLYPEKEFEDFEPPPETIPDSPGFHREWIQACKGGEPATCHFGYSGPLAETVLLGNVAYRAGKAFDWDAERLEARGAPEAQELIRPAFRKGWKVRDLG